MAQGKEIAPATPPVSNFLEVISRAASDPAVDVVKMQALLEMQERIVAKQAEAEFNSALARLMPKLPRIKKNGEVEYAGKKAFKFAKWEDIDASIRPLLLEEGFSLSFNTAPRQGDAGGIVVIGTLSHVGGHSRQASIPLALDGSGGKNSIQGMGSTFSYGKRYCTTMLLNLVFEGEDDDGQRGGMQFITPAQVQEIEALLTETKADRVGFLRFMGVDSIGEIQTKQFVSAITMLNRKKNKQQ